MGTHEEFLRDTDLADRYGVTRVTIWRWRQTQPDFPRPIYLSANCTRFRLSDVLAWEEKRAKEAA